MMPACYYLHTNGSLIYKPNAEIKDLRDSDFVVMFWPIEQSNRLHAWTILIEASALGADPERIKQLAELWKCNDEDAHEYAKRAGATLTKDGSNWCASSSLHFINLQESHAGFSSTALGALASLAKQLGFKASKIWGPSFIDHLHGGHHDQRRSV